MLTKKDEIYIINQPKKLVLSLIVVDNHLDCPLDDDTHENLGWLTEYSDVFFVFTESHWSGQKMVDKIKFTSLYNGCGFIDSSNKKLGNSFIKVLNYDKEIMSITKNHLGFTVSLLSEVKKFKESDLNKIINNILPNNISRPIYKERRLGSTELFNIYSLGDTVLDKFPSLKSAGLKIKSVFNIILNALLRKKHLDTDGVGMFCTWHAYCPLIYIPKITIDTMLSRIDEEKEDFDYWVNTFITPDPRYFFASLIRYLGIDTLNFTIDSVKI